MAPPTISPEWTEFALTKPEIINHAADIPQVRDAINQQSLKNIAMMKELFSTALEAVIATNTVITLPEVTDHSFAIRVYKPARATDSLPVLLYFHSGFWSTGNTDTDDLGCRAIIAHGNDLIIISFEYRLAPETPWYTIFSDAEHAVIWTSNHATSFGGNIHEGFLVGGALAGAHLAAISAIRSRDRHPEIKISGQLLLVPTVIVWTDIETLPQTWKQLVTSHNENSEAPLLTEVDFQRYLKLLDVPDTEKRKGDNFPVWADLKGLPPAYLAMDGPDPIRDEGYLYEKLLREAGVKTRTDHYELPNWFVQFPKLKSTGRAGLELATGVRWLLEVGKHTM